MGTLITGGLAVWAAKTIGLEQAKILASQNKIAENSLKIQLLEARSKCVSEMRDVYSSYSADGALRGQDWIKFKELYQKSRLLFPKSFVQKIEQAVDSTFFAEHHLKRSRDFNERGLSNEAEKALQKAFMAEDKSNDLIPTMLSDMIEYSRIDFWD